MERNRSGSHRGLSRRLFLAGGMAVGGGLTGLDLLGSASGVTPAWAQATGTPKRGGTLTAAADVDPVSLDPHTNSNFSSMHAFDHIYESLTGYD